MMAAIYFQTRRVMEDEIFRANSALLTQFQQDIDNYIDFTSRMAEVISLNPAVASIIRDQVSLGAVERISMWKTLADFKTYNIAKRYVDHFYLYFHEGDFVLTDSSYYPADMYYDLYVSPSGIPKEQWRNRLIAVNPGGYTNLYEWTGDTDTGIMYTQPLPLQQRSSSRATLVIEFDQEQLMTSIRNIQSYNQGEVYILNADDQLIASSEPKGEKKRGLDLPARPKGSFHTMAAQWEGEDMIVSFMESSRTNWKYVYVLPARLYSEKTEYVRNMTLLTVLFAAIAGSVSAVLLARRNYHPLQRLIESVSERSKLAPSAKLADNEYDYLEEAIEDALDRNTVMNRTIEKQNKTLRSNLLVRMLKGRIGHDFPLLEVLPEYGISLYTGGFAVLIFYLEDYSGFFRQDEQDEEKKREFVQLIMTNIVEELAGQYHQGWMAEVDDMLACIVNFRPDTSPEAAMEDLQRVAEEAERFIGNRFHIQFTISISSLHPSAAEIPAAYQEALDAMEYRMLMGARTIIRHDQIRQEVLSYAYPLEKEQKLINLIGSGDYTNAKSLLEEIIAFNLAQPNISVDIIRCLMFDISSTMMKAAMEANTDNKEMFQDNVLMIQGLMNGMTVAAMIERMSVFLKKVCELADDRKKSSKLKLKESVLQYIAEHYHDQNLSVTSISEHFDLHPSYLSRYFKEQTGETLAEYINKYRIDQSKPLLLRDELLIKDISTQVGFFSINTYIRLFKKFEGITPSFYRENRSAYSNSGGEGEEE
jgi:AraC-like DNA-binding protein